MPRLQIVGEFHPLDGMEVEEYFEGEQWTYTGSALDSAGNPIDLQGDDMRVTAEYYKIRPEISGDNLIISALDSDASIAPRSLASRITVPEQGAFEIDVPEDLYPNDVEPNLRRDVPLIVIWITITDLPANFAQIDKERFGLIVRHAR